MALTKVDLVDPDLLELAREDVAAAVLGSFLEGAPIVPVSATTGEGLEGLVAAVDALARAVPQRGAKGLFRLPVDRVFTMRGFGTVVTGTIISGAVRKDEELESLPGERRAKVRGVQVHGQAVDRAAAGQRTALNLSGVEVADLTRGDTLVQVGTLETTHMLDARVEVLPGARGPIANRDRVRLHTGTQEVPVVVALLNGDELRPGEGGYAQLRSPARMVVCPGDRFVLRQFSPAATLGGGVVLDHRPRRHKGRRNEVLERLAVLEGEDAGARLAAFVEARGPAGMDPQAVQAALGVPLEEARNLLQAAARTGVAVVTDRKAQRHHHRDVVVDLEERALELLAAFHAENPLRKGLGVEELRTKFPRYIGPRLVEFVLGRLTEAGRVVMDGEVVRRSDFTLRLSADDQGVRRRIEEMLAARGYEAPSLEDAAAALGEDPKALRPVFDYLAGQGLLHRTKEGLYFETRRLEELARKVVALLESKGELGVADVKDLTGTTRKYTVPLLEYLDAQKITLRKGDVRVLGPRGRT
ncbi:MAG: SelB C-terminal domain-containing protein [Proteobacteria bacterium]|nr:SelB C-terminal domain-containing protein [Pseudomonadota bacterium]